MSCPNWHSLIDRRDRDPEAWTQALAHFDECADCRDQALAEEPTLMFRNLPAPTVGSDDIAAMKQAVAVLRRSSDTGSGSGSTDRQIKLSSGWRNLLAPSSWLRAAALAALVVGAVALQGNDRAGDEITTSPTASFEIAAVRAETVLGSRQALDPMAVEDLPLVEAVDPSYGSVVQIVDDEISLVLVLPANDV